MRAAQWLAAAALLLGCGGTAKTSDVLVTSGANSRKDNAPSAPLAAQIAQDERLAAAILGDLLTSDDVTLAGWSAVHGRRLGLKQDETERSQALRRCLRAPELDPLLRACCWRWAIDLEPSFLASLPSPQESTSMVLAAVSVPPQSVSPSLLAALALPETAHDDAPSRHAAEVLSAYVALAAPFDDGPLALAIAFLEARRAGWKDAEDTHTDTPLSATLRDALARRMGVSPNWSAIDALPAVETESSPLVSRLANAIAAQPLDALRAMAVGGEPSLRQEALRALAIRVSQPSARDLGAAAAGLRATDPRTRLEAARTFLLLSIRAHAP